MFAATLLLGVVTVGLASVPPRPLRSALAVGYALSVRVATDWLVVLALLAVADRYTGSRTVDRATVRRLAALVLLGGLAVEVSPFVRLVVEPAPVGTARLTEGLVVAVQGVLFPAGLFVATVAGAATVRDALGDRPGHETADGSSPESPGGLPLAPSTGWVPAVTPAAVRRAVAVLAVVAGGAFALETGARFLVGAPHAAFVVLDAAVGALGELVDYAVLAVAFLALAVDGVRVRSLVGGVVGVWAVTFVLSFLVAALGAGLAVGLVGVTTTTMAAVESSTLGAWPAPDSWELLLRSATFVAGGVGLLAIQRTSPGKRPREPESAADVDANTSANGTANE